MKPKLKSATISALACITLSSCGEAAESSSRPDETTTVTTTTAVTTTTTAATTTAPVTTSATVTETAASSLPPDDSSKPKEALSEELFQNALEDVEVKITDDRIVQTSVVNDRAFSLIIDLSKWENNTTPEDMVQLSRLFWQCYPKMFERFGEMTEAPYDVILAIENEGYPIAEASGNFVHLHDMWLPKNPGDYDCITHELGHVVQNGSMWDDAFLEFSNYSEVFADACRYEYPLDGGYYNDAVWPLQTAETQDSRETSVRFLIWLDYMYSDYSQGIDLLYRYCSICVKSSYSSDQWADAWQDIFQGTALEGKSVDEVWKMYTDSEFAYYSSEAEKGETSELLSNFDVRGKVSGIEQ